MARIAQEKQYNMPKVGYLAKKSEKRERDKEYLAWLHELPCCVSGVTNGVIAHHITIERGRMGVKADDSLALPLSHVLHDQHPGALHKVGERKFWNTHGINPFLLAKSLHLTYTDYNKNLAFAKAIINAHRDLGRWCVANGVAHFTAKKTEEGRTE